EMVGPGRHFYCPLWWECTLVPDTLIKPGEVGIVTSKMGKNQDADKFLVDGEIGATDFKGTLRRALPPGRYRINPYAYDVKTIQQEMTQTGNQTKHFGWVEIPTGYVGVVTNLADDSKGNGMGVQKEVLPPGLYIVNSREQQVDIVNIGYREKSIVANLKNGPGGMPLYDSSGEPIIEEDGSGIGFPSSDGFNIRMDFTAIWGIMPHQAAEVIDKYGNVDAVEEKVIEPQIESICRNMGSSNEAKQLLIGDSRLKFQEATSEEFAEVLKKAGISVLNGLVRHVYIPQEVRTPIQEKNIADELKLTREQEQLTAETEGDFREAEQKVELATETVRVETEKKVAQALAEGEKTAKETAATTQKLVAEIDAQTAAVEADATRMLGEADAGARQLLEEARADKFQLAVGAFGSGEAYNNWVFAQGLPEDIQLDMLYAGEGTFWTDLRGFTDVMVGRQAQETLRGKSPARPTAGKRSP
ncbi:MAG: SPFH domain-containing protein, partial [Planctomycetaceae bacterium]